MSENGDRKYDDAVLKAAWDVLERDAGILEALCQRSIRRAGAAQRVSVEEAMSELAVRLPDMVAAWDPARQVTLRTHVVASARWYLFKMLVSQPRRERRRAQRLGERATELDRSAQVDGLDELEASHDRELVQSLLSSTAVSEQSREVLDLYFRCGLTYDELGDELGVSRTTVRRMLIGALGQVREVARRHDLHGDT